MTVAVTGMGVVSVAGHDLHAVDAALREGRSGLTRLTRFSSRRNADLPVAQLPGRVRPARYWAWQAARDAWTHAGLTDAHRSGAGVVLGGTVGGLPETEAHVARAWDPDHVAGAPDPDLYARRLWRFHEVGSVASTVAARLGAEGPCTTISTACASGAQALSTGMDLIESGVADVVLAGGADTLSRLTFNGFASLLAIDPDGCRPFDRARGGMSLGEGAAVLVLESLDHAQRRGAEVLAELLGAGNTCDAHHPTAPHPDGQGAAAAIRAALARADLPPDAVDYVNAHGTGTRDNDRAEGRALRAVFGDRLPAVSSTKRVFGHALGASGALESVACVLALRGQFVPGTVGLQDPDPECEVDPVRTTRPQPLDVVLNHAFGFGGVNTVLCFRRGTS